MNLLSGCEGKDETGWWRKGTEREWCKKESIHVEGVCRRGLNVVMEEKRAWKRDVYGK